MLHEFLTKNRDEILGNARALGAARARPAAPSHEVQGAAAGLLDQLVEALRTKQAAESKLTNAAVGSAALCGPELRQTGLALAQVFHDYGDLCRAVVELATDKDVAITTAELRTFNRCLEDAVAAAVSEYDRNCKRAREGGEAGLGFLVHELRNRISNALLAFDVLKSGPAGVGGGTGALLRRNLLAVRDLIDLSLVQVRLETEPPKPPLSSPAPAKP